MEEENRGFRFTNILIKALIVIIFILFTVWLISLSQKGIKNSLGALTDDIFAENLNKMKEVGKEYFTTERLPKKIGEVKTLSLAKMYDAKYLLELKDKDGNYCSAANSYVSVEKLENEYQMKVYLECGENSDYIISIMGCYDYCKNTICENKDNDNKVDDNNQTPTPAKNIQYEYKLQTGGYWTDYGNWSEWSKVSVTNTDYRQVETKVVKEDYSYDKEVPRTEYQEYTTICPNGYFKTADGQQCYKQVSETVYANPQCPATYNGGTFVSRDGFTCKYTKATTVTVSPNKCQSSYNGYKLTSQNGFTCNYSKTVQVPYQVPVTIPKTCYSQKIIKSCSTCAPVIQNIPYDCSTTGYETRYRTETRTTTTTVGCPSGSTKTGNSCVKPGTETLTSTANCKSGYSKTADGSTCYKVNTSNKYENIAITCPAKFSLTSDKTKCYRNYTETIRITDVREVTYYRYRIREYVNGTVDYKWSNSKEDKNLLDKGYKLTGKTREVK